LAFGSLSASGNSLEIQAWLNDVRDSSLAPVIGKVYRGDVSDAQVRIFENQHQITQLHTISLTPRWSPDASRIAFTCYAPRSGSVLTAQICVQSMLTNHLIAWPRFQGTNA